MKKRLLVLLALLALLYGVSAFAQGVDDSTIGVDSAVERAISADMPVDGIGYALYGLYKDILDAIAKTTAGAGSALTQSFRGTAIIIMALYVYFVALNMMRGNVESLRDSVTTIVLVIITTTIAFSPSLYAEWIVGPLVGTINSVQDFLVTKVSGSAGGNVFKSLSAGMDKVMSVATIMEATVPFYSLIKQLTVLIAQVLLAASFIAVIVTFMLINIMSWATIYLIAVFGGILTYMAAFKATRHLFWAWVKAICTAGMTLIFAALIMSICLQILTIQVDILAAQDFNQSHPLFNKATFMCIATCVLTWCLLLRAPDLAAQLTGGSAGNTAGIAGLVGASAGAVYGGVKMAAAKRFKGMGGNIMQGYRDGRSGAYTGGSYSASARKGIQNY